jgi:WD40 repeat protein
VRGVAFAPEGKRLASVSEDTTVRLWDARTGKEVHRYSGHEQMVTGVAFSGGGKYIVSGGGGSRDGGGKMDSALRLWAAPDLASTPKSKK